MFFANSVQKQPCRNGSTGFWEQYDDTDPDSTFGFLENAYNIYSEDHALYQSAMHNVAESMSGGQTDDIALQFAKRVVLDYTPYTFLHGDCNIFAQYLHETYGYDIEAVMFRGAGGKNLLIHMYCVDGSGADTEYIDIRGRCDDFSLLMAEYCDWFDEDDEDVFIQRFSDMPEEFVVRKEDAWRKAVAKGIDNKYGFYSKTPRRAATA